MVTNVVSLLISDMTNFVTRKVIRKNGRHCLIIQRPIIQVELENNDPKFVCP